MNSNASGPDPLERLLTSLVEKQGDLLLKVVAQQGEGSRAELDRLAKIVAEQVKSRSGELDATERALADRYARLRQQLAGPDDGLTLEGVRVRTILPESGPAGTVMTLELQDAGSVDAVTFTGANGAQLPAVIRSSHGQSVQVEVPAGAEDGPVTVQTSRGAAVSEVPFTVADAQPPASVERIFCLRGVYFT